MKFDFMARGIVTIASVAIAIVVIREAGLGLDPEDLKSWVDSEVRGNGIAGSLLFVAAGTLFTGVGLSRQVLAFAGGYAFGVAMGSGLALIAEIGGVALAFAYARFLGRDFVVRRFPSKVRRVDEFLSINPFLTTLAVRLLPISNNLAVNLLAGVSGVRTIPFLAGSAVGHAPQTVVFALLGSGLSQGIVSKSVLAVVLFLISVAIGVYLYRKYRHGKDFDEDFENALEAPEDYGVTGRRQEPRTP